MSENWDKEKSVVTHCNRIRYTKTGDENEKCKFPTRWNEFDRNNAN